MDDLPMKSISHGFPGEHRVLLPGPVRDAARSHPLLRGLFPTDAGYFPEARSHGIKRPNGVDTAILIVCRAGRGWMRLRGERREIRADEAGILAPNEPHAYGADSASPWTIQWVHFTGSALSAWWKYLRLPPEGGVLRLAPGGAERLDLFRVHEALARGYGERNLLRASAALRWGLSNLGSEESGGSAREAVGRVESWMREHTGSRATLAELACHASLSPSHFSALFRERYGFAPLDYFFRLKIRRACTLLDSTDWSIARVANELGFEDPLYFSRRFHKVMGLSPREYRAESSFTAHSF